MAYTGPGKRDTEKKKTLRAFLAVPVPDRVLEHLRKIQTELASSGVNVRWVKLKNIHLTLKFFGEIDVSRIPSLAEQLDRSTGSISPFSLQAKGVGVFPNLRRARVVWAGLTGELPALQSLHEAVEKCLAEVGFSRERRRFHPHLTIGRCKKYPDGRVLGRALQSVQESPSDRFIVNRLCLYRSDLTPVGATYTSLHTSDVQGSSLPSTSCNGR